jgi:dienelactone hydrolase
MKRCPGVIVCVVLCWLASGAAAQVVDPAKVGGLLSRAPAEWYHPAGTTPIAAVVVLHGCDGIGLHYRQGAQARDALDSAAYLCNTLRIPARRIGVIGFSHGGDHLYRSGECRLPYIGGEVRFRRNY